MTTSRDSAEPLSFLILIADQLPARALGFAGDPVVATPNLDALAARSMVFDTAYVANPICMPNRASLITGRYPSSHGTRTNGIPLNWNAETVARVLRRANYRTGAAGKLHLQPYGAAEDVTRALVGTTNGSGGKRGLPTMGSLGEPHDSWVPADRTGRGLLRIRSCRSRHRWFRHGRGPLSPLAPQPRGGPGALARPRQRAGGPGRLGSGLQDGSAREPLPHELHRRPDDPVPRRRRRHGGALLLLVVISGPAPSLHPARSLLRHVRPRRCHLAGDLRRPTHAWPHPTSGR